MDEMYFVHYPYFVSESMVMLFQNACPSPGQAFFVLFC